MEVRPEQIRGLKTEQRNPRTMDVDLLSTVDMVRRINDENRVLADAVEEQAEQIAAAVDIITERMQRGETDLIDVYQMLENTARPQVAPTARTANNLGSAGFNAHTLSDEEFERIRQLTRNGHNVRI